MSKRPDPPKVIPHSAFPYEVSHRVPTDEVPHPWFIFNTETAETIRWNMVTKREALNWALFNLGFQP